MSSFSFDVAKVVHIFVKRKFFGFFFINKMKILIKNAPNIKKKLKTVPQNTYIIEQKCIFAVIIKKRR